MKAKKVKETPEQVAERKRSEAARFKAIQREVTERTSQFQRLSNSRASLFGGGVQSWTSLVGVQTSQNGGSKFFQLVREAVRRS